MDAEQSLSMCKTSRLVICDEPVSALDVSHPKPNTQPSQWITERTQSLVPAHDLAVVKHISDRIAIMYLGKIVETGRGEDIHHAPQTPHTQSLISAIPIPDPHRRAKRTVLSGDVPSPIDPPSGCAFHPRCPLATERCRQETPVLRQAAEANQWVACHMVA